MDPTGWPAGTLLPRLRPRTRDALLSLGTPRRAGTGEVLLRQGTVGTHVVLLRRLTVKVTASATDGRTALLGVRFPGDVVGESSVLTGRPRSATVTTCGPGTVNSISAAEFRMFLNRHPDAAIEITRMVTDRLDWANRRRIDLTGSPVKVRLARILAEIADDHGVPGPAGLTLGVPLTQPELAAMCGAAEVSVQKAVRELRTAGVIATGYRKILITDRAGLDRLAEDGD